MHDLMIYKQAAEDILGTSIKLPDTTLAKLLEAKRESDRKNYRAKHEILRKLLKEQPHNFHIDSEEGSITGLTHTPSRFRIHAPRKIIPQPELLRRVVNNG